MRKKNTDFGNALPWHVLVWILLSIESSIYRDRFLKVIYAHTKRGRRFKSRNVNQWNHPCRMFLIDRILL